MEVSNVCRCGAADIPHTHPRYADNSFWEPYVPDSDGIVSAGMESEIGKTVEPTPAPSVPEGSAPEPTPTTEEVKDHGN